MTEREQFEALPRDLKLFVVLMLGIDNHDEAKALLVQIIQAARAAPARDQEALMALNIARYMQERFYPEAKDFEPLNDLMGLLTQISNMATGLARAAPAQPAGKTALERFNELKVAQDESDPVEQLRAFCSLAMTGQDWLDVEPFFDAVLAARAAQAQPSNEWLSEALRWQAATAEAAHLLTDRGGGYIFIAPDGTTIESSDAQDFVARVRAALKNADHS